MHDRENLSCALNKKIDAFMEKHGFIDFEIEGHEPINIGFEFCFFKPTPNNPREPFDSREYFRDSETYKTWMELEVDLDNELLTKYFASKGLKYRKRKYATD